MTDPIAAADALEERAATEDPDTAELLLARADEYRAEAGGVDVARWAAA